MSDSLTIAPNDAEIATDTAIIATAPAMVRKAHVYVDPALLAFLGILVSLLIVAVIFHDGKNGTESLIVFLAILIPWLWYCVKLIFGVKVKLRFEDNVLIEEQQGVETRIPLSDIANFNFISSSFGGDYIRLKFKSASGTFRYTPVSATAKDEDPFMEIADDLEYAINETNLTAALDGVTDMDNPALIEQALQSAPQISMRPSFGWRLWRLFQIVLTLSIGVIYLVKTIRLLRVRDPEGYILAVLIVGMIVWIVVPSKWKVWLTKWKVWPRKKKPD